MKALLVLLCGVMTAPAALGAELPAPIAEAGAGRAQCYAPNTAGKTCNSLARYKLENDGTISKTSLTLLSKSLLITMETVSPVTIKNGQVCGAIRKQDIEKAKFMSDGKPLDPKAAATLRQQINVALKDTFNHDICTEFTVDGGALVAKGTIDGAALPGSLPVIWVSQEDGYKVGP
jgi:hypothetical protein